MNPWLRRISDRVKELRAEIAQWRPAFQRSDAMADCIVVIEHAGTRYLRIP